MVRNLPASAEDVSHVGLIPGSGRSSGGEHVNPLQYSCLENPLDRGAWPGFSPWGRKESNTTEATQHSTYIHINIQRDRDSQVDLRRRSLLLDAEMLTKPP